MSGEDSKRLAGAPIVMKERGEQTDLDIYDYVQMANTIYKVKDILSFQLIVTRIVDHKNGWFF